MKILFLSNLYPPNVIGGYEQLCFGVAGAFAKRGHEIVVLTSTYGGGDLACPGQRILRSLRLFATEDNIYKPFECTVDEREAIIADNLTRLERTLELERPDVVFAWNLYFLDPSLLEALQICENVVYFLTDNWLITFRNRAFNRRYFRSQVFGDSSWASLMYERLLRSASLMYETLLRSATSLGQPNHFVKGRAIFPSEFMRRLYTSAGFTFENSVVIPHGVKGLGHPARIGDRARLRKPGELRLLFAGRVVDVKGVHSAIDALPHVIAGLPDLKVTLTVVGDTQDGGYLERLNGQVQKHRLQRAVTFLTAIAEDELFEVFQRHDIYLFPSLYEPFSLTLIHALAAGIPTIASDAGGNPEIVRHRETGLIFPKGNSRALASAVIELARDSGLRLEVSEQAVRVASDYSFERMIEGIGAYLEQDR